MASSPDNFLTTPFLSQENALFEHIDSPYTTGKSCVNERAKMKDTRQNDRTKSTER